MSEEEIKKLAKEEFINNIMEHLDSTLIFIYIQKLESQLQQKENIIKEVREYIRQHIRIIHNERTGTFENDLYMKEKALEVFLEILDKEKL